MTFFTFLLYFFISHLVYTVILSGVAAAIQYYNGYRQSKSIKELIDGGQIQLVQIDEEDGGQWH